MVWRLISADTYLVVCHLKDFFALELVAIVEDQKAKKETDKILPGLILRAELDDATFVALLHILSVATTIVGL